MVIFRVTVQILLATLFFLAGVLHLSDPALFVPLMPEWIPLHITCIIVSGVFELLGAVGLLVPFASVRRVTGWCLILLLVAVFPANVHMAVAHIQVHGMPSKPWMAWARLPLQPILIVAVAWVTGIWQGTCKKGGSTNDSNRNH
jgi:uncharacterized membrane protein